MKRNGLFLSVALFALPSFVFSEGNSFNKEVEKVTNKKPDTWQTTLGLGFGYGSIYQGAAKQQFFLLPVIDASYGNWNFGLLSGIQNSFINTDNLQVSAGLGYDFGRRDKDLPKRYKGLGDIDGGLITNASINYQPIDLIDLSFGVSKSQGDAKSLLLTAGIGTEFPLYGESLSGNLSATLTWANDDHMNAYYGVDAAQSAKTKFKRFKAKAGIESINYSAGITYLINKNWVYTASAGVDVYQGDAKDSPIVEDSTQPFFFNTLSYSF
jgi:MipA family protein